MCRLLAISSSEPTEFRIVLREAPRSLAALSREHRDGWGLAIHHNDDGVSKWNLHRGVAQASEDEHFHRVAVGSRGELLIAHIRQRTVGPIAIDNTHPFTRGTWAFAHNGTIEDISWMRSRISRQRLEEVRGTTDSELLFSLLLTYVDENPGDVDGAMRRAVRDARARPAFGAFNFVISNGVATWAHRFGRSLFLLERGPHDRVVPSRTSRETGAEVQTPWSQRRHAVFVASERLTDEPWQEISTGTLLRIDLRPEPRWRLLDILPESSHATTPSAAPAPSGK